MRANLFERSDSVRRRHAAAGTTQSFWPTYDALFAKAKYIDLTHAFSPRTPLGPDFGPLEFKTAHLHGSDKDVAFDYPTVDAAITAYELSTDQVGTQLDPPAHGNAHGATINEFPAIVRRGLWLSPTWSIRSRPIPLSSQRWTTSATGRKSMAVFLQVPW
ncbi:cyclase family protein [Paraburkholderia sp.]|uniref:cyclase family protein n=1 Tax=Paraburkholderia sp. TaxID=1926495 RepID=UPI003D6FA528